MRNLTRFLPLLIFIAVAVQSCDTQDATESDNNERELITHVTLRLVDTGNVSDTVIASFADADGEGGLNPIVSRLNLGAGKTYHGTITLWDSSKFPAVDLTEEIYEERNSHRFSFDVGLTGWVSVTARDLDNNGLPVGLKFKVASNPGFVASSRLDVSLLHFRGDGKKNGAAGEPDIKMQFPITFS